MRVRCCPNNCTFCSTKSFWGPKSRVHSPKRMIEEIKFLREEYGFAYFVLYHDNLLVHKRFLKEFCDLFKKNFAGLHFGIYGSVNFVSEEIIQLLSSSGCYSIFLGLETISNNMCKYIPTSV
ncbi:MAG: B12-binding domain-containing radical SAM protein [Candidatus Hodarchaeota archaeon]